MVLQAHSLILGIKCVNMMAFPSNFVKFVSFFTRICINALLIQNLMRICFLLRRLFPAGICINNQRFSATLRVGVIFALPHNPLQRISHIVQRYRTTKALAVTGLSRATTGKPHGTYHASLFPKATPKLLSCLPKTCAQIMCLTIGIPLFKTLATTHALSKKVSCNDQNHKRQKNKAHGLQ